MKTEYPLFGKDEKRKKANKNKKQKTKGQNNYSFRELDLQKAYALSSRP